ncbi:MAG: ABC transporter permease [Holophagaceae bacterium]|nr:ABC transporter permease [Holophagaceae bacterium]
MLTYVAKKEILEHLKSFRFLVAFIFILVTFFIMISIRHFEYRSNWNDYLLKVKSQEEALEKYTSYDRNIALSFPIIQPSPMEIIVAPAVNGTVFQAGRSLDDNPIKSITIKLDIIALVGILGSLLTLLLSYDSINREVNCATMRLLLSTGIPKIKIILGKILGGSLVAILPITVIFLILPIWIGISDAPAFNLNQLASLFGIFLSSIVYVIFFYCLGTLASSMFLDQTLSAFSCFSVWILLIIVVPVSGSYLAKTIVKVPDLGAIQRQVLRMRNSEKWETVNKLVAPYIAQGMSESEAQKKIDMAKIDMEISGRVTALRDEYSKAVTRQTKLSIRFACISPYTNFLVAVEELSGFGIERFDHLENLVNSWRVIAREYLASQYNQTKKINPGFRTSDRIDVSGMPRFRYVESTIGYKLLHALPYILLLTAYFVVLPFVFVYVLYSRRRLF